MSNWFKRNSIHFIIAAILIVISYAYFFSPLMQGKALQQSDVIQAGGSQKEIMDVMAKTGHAPLWTNSMFGGMPTYQIWMQMPANVTGYVIEAMKTIFPNPIDTVLLLLFGAYLLFNVLKLNPWLAAAGAIAFTFSSYNFILIYAGHSNQVYAIAFFAPIIAGIILTLRGRYLLGCSVTAFFLAMEIRCNHVQMTYYLMLAVIILVIVELYDAIQKKQLKVFGKAIIYLAGATLLAVAVNATLLWTTAEYGAETNRGQSNLTQHTTEPSNGLDKNYAYGWSQGVGECITFLIPNAYGGPTQQISADAIPNSNITKALVNNSIPEDKAESIVQQIGFDYYWGNKPGTAGPYYFGAIICFLFILGLIIIKDRLKWWLLATVILSMLLSFGSNWPYVSDWFFNHFPLYNKFRTVESILAIAELCFPIMALLAIQEVIVTADKKELLKKVLLAFYITGGLTLLLILLPDVFFNFKSQQYEAMLSGLTKAFGGNGAIATAVMSGLVQDRIGLFRADAIRSLIFIILAFGILWLYIKQKVNLTLASVAFLAVILIDMWGVDRRYLNDSNFVEKQDYSTPVPLREVDKIILRDPDPDYRVFDDSYSNAEPFANAAPSYYYKSVGGYHAAKLKRYDELITNQFSKSINYDVLDMLNTKYFIIADSKTGAVSMRANNTACGHAWFVKSVKYAANADQEMQAISSFDPKNEAIVDQQYKSLLNSQNLRADTAHSSITLTSYKPDTLMYFTSSPTSQIAVFSEIYYKEGWKFYIDDKEQPYFRADYLLRAAVIPVGNHKLKFIFHPASYYTGEDISLAGSILLVAALGGAAYAENKRKKAEPKTEKKPVIEKKPEPKPVEVKKPEAKKIDPKKKK